MQDIPGRTGRRAGICQGGKGAYAVDGTDADRRSVADERKPGRMVRRRNRMCGDRVKADKQRAGGGKRLRQDYAKSCRGNRNDKRGQEDAITLINNLKLITTGDKASDSTRSRHLRQCRRIFNVAVKWGYIKANPFDDIKLGKIKKGDWQALTMDQFGDILRAVDNCSRVTKKNEAADKIRIHSLKTFYAVMYYCGLRFGEAANLLWDSEDIDFTNNQINLSNRSPQKDIPMFSVKDYESRSISVPQKVMNMLKELKEKSKPESPFVFLSPTAYQRLVERWHTYNQQGKEDWNNKNVISNARRDFKWYCVKAGITTSKKLNLHSLRKGYGTNMANLGIPANTLKDLMGHSSIVTTMEFYVKTLDENKIAAAEKLNAVAVM